MIKPSSSSMENLLGSLWSKMNPQAVAKVAKESQISKLFLITLQFSPHHSKNGNYSTYTFFCGFKKNPQPPRSIRCEASILNIHK